ncbi:hypothetical protein CERSUDRAFT_73773 [Gelatoporia subvermispora B]|uniref:SUN domain-containing protein n=1 Tax=Ceriporiopsis subvermispora (strain B) TaxID=914234 RepID=M2RD23_CERS8|nr:hypothetical protein CERSUDRAFT_73773 [Gelatoporia subvermispora B]
MQASQDEHSQLNEHRLLRRRHLDSEACPEPKDALRVVHFKPISSVTAHLERNSTEPASLPPLSQVPWTKRLILLLSILVVISCASFVWAQSLFRNSTCSHLVPSASSHTTEPVPTISPALKAEIENLVITTINAYKSDSQGLPDFALSANGGHVARQITSGYQGFFGSRANDPSIAISDDTHAGRCWKVHQLPTQLGIRLPIIIRPSQVSVEHLLKENAVDIRQAPKNMTLWGVVDGKSNMEAFKTLMASNHLDRNLPTPMLARDLRWAPLASFMYDIHHRNHIQTFPISQDYIDSEITFGIVALEILENWGSGVWGMKTTAEDQRGKWRRQLRGYNLAGWRASRGRKQTAE